MSERTETMPVGKDLRILELDGLRGLAILMVLVWHYLVIPWEDASGAAGFLLRRFCFTWSGVDLFFVLSGFLITGILLKARDSSTTYFKAFYMRRVFRIFPLYYLLLLVFLLSKPALAGTYPELYDTSKVPLWTYFLYIQNYFMAGEGFGASILGVTWSLAVEEQFYIVVPFLIKFLPRKWLIRVVLAGIVICPVLRLLTTSFTSLVSTHLRVDSLLFGALLAIVLAEPEIRGWLERGRSQVAWLSYILLFAVGLYTLRNPGPGDPMLHSFLAAAYVVILLSVLLYRGEWGTGVFRWSPLCWLGTRSYFIYLFHELVRLLAKPYSPDAMQLGQPDPMFAVSALVAFSVTAVCAEVSYRYFEQPLVRIGHRFKY